MREIKFRAWDKKAKQMFIVREMTWLEGGLNVTDGGSPLGGFDCEIMRFTGLLDKLGVEIYEGDIVEMDKPPFSMLGFVEWDENYFGVNTGEESHIKDHGHNINLHSDTPFGHQNLEIIGNVHENKDLLK